MLPTKLKAGGQEFTIEYKDFVAPGKRGLVNYGQTRIDIRSDRDIQTQAETIIHEAFHIAEVKSKLKLEEKIVQTFGRVLFSVLRDNPDLFNQDTIRICGFDYKVLRVDVVDKDSDEDLASWTKYCEFRLAGDLSSENHGLHLIYMVLDAIETVLSTDLDQDAKHRLGDWLHAILKDNPQIWPHNVIDQPQAINCEGNTIADGCEGINCGENVPGEKYCAETPPCQMSWFKCDKGWFGVPKYGSREAKEIFSSYNMPGVCLSNPDMQLGVSLSDMMTWATQNDIPYKISTVEPKKRDG